MPSIPELTIIDVLNTIVDTVKQSRPTQTSGKQLSSGFVYSQLILGMPISKADYDGAWSPNSSGPATGVPAASGTNTKPTAAMEAAFKTSQLCDLMLQVTDDGAYSAYETGRNLSFEYSSLIGAMTAIEVPPLPDAEQAALTAATNVLFVMDNSDPANPVIVEQTPLYKRYVDRASKYAHVKAAYTAAEAKTLADPTTANLWPQLSAPYQQDVDDAWNDWKAGGADKVEAALAAYESQGINMQQAQIAKAKKLYDVWNLGLAGVPTTIPYSYVEPSQWSNPDADDIGFETLDIKRTSKDDAASTVTDSNRSMYWNNHQNSSSGSSSASLGLFGSISGSGSAANQEASSGDQANTTSTENSMDQCSDFEVALEWALVDIRRPWLISDLFYMNNWYIQGERAGYISDGTVEGQLGNSPSRLPAIPQQMLVIRNVKITSSSWGDTGHTLQQTFSADHSSTGSSQVSGSGSGGFHFGPIGASGSGQHSSNSAQGASSGSTQDRSSDSHTTSFDGTTLEIDGAQIIAFLSDIVPLSPQMDDPALPRKKAPVNLGPTSTDAQPVAAGA